MKYRLELTESRNTVDYSSSYESLQSYRLSIFLIYNVWPLEQLFEYCSNYLNIILFNNSWLSFDLFFPLIVSIPNLLKSSYALYTISWPFIVALFKCHLFSWCKSFIVSHHLDDLVNISKKIITYRANIVDNLVFLLNLLLPPQKLLNNDNGYPFNSWIRGCLLEIYL